MNRYAAGEVAEDGDDDGRTVAAEPHGGGDGAEQRDERQRVAHQRVEQPPEQDRRHERGERQPVGGQGVWHSPALPVADRLRRLL